MDEKNAVVGVYKSHSDAEQSIKELQKAGFDMAKLSVVGKDYHTEEHVVGYYSVGDRMKAWGKLGAFWGGLWGLLFGAAFLFRARRRTSCRGWAPSKLDRRSFGRSGGGRWSERFGSWPL